MVKFDDPVIICTILRHELWDTFIMTFIYTKSHISMAFHHTYRYKRRWHNTRALSTVNSSIRVVLNHSITIYGQSNSDINDTMSGVDYDDNNNNYNNNTDNNNKNDNDNNNNDNDNDNNNDNNNRITGWYLQWYWW